MRKFYLLILFPIFIVESCNSSIFLSMDNSYDIYLLVGQSNMAGRGEIEKVDSMMHPRVYVLNAQDSIVLAKEPLHYDKKKEEQVLDWNLVK